MTFSLSHLSGWFRLFTPFFKWRTVYRSGNLDRVLVLLAGGEDTLPLHVVIRLVLLNIDLNLFLLQATTEDTGKYTVTATNVGGSVSSTVAVTVEGKSTQAPEIGAQAPEIGEMPKPQNLKPGDTLTLTCKIIGKIFMGEKRVS